MSSSPIPNSSFVFVHLKSLSPLRSLSHSHSHHSHHSHLPAFFFKKKKFGLNLNFQLPPNYPSTLILILILIAFIRRKFDIHSFWGGVEIYRARQQVGKFATLAIFLDPTPPHDMMTLRGTYVRTVFVISRSRGSHSIPIPSHLISFRFASSKPRCRCRFGSYSCFLFLLSFYGNGNGRAGM